MGSESYNCTPKWNENQASQNNPKTQLTLKHPKQNIQIKLSWPNMKTR